MAATFIGKHYFAFTWPPVGGREIIGLWVGIYKCERYGGTPVFIRLPQSFYY